MRLSEQIAWYLDRLDLPPVRVHVRELWEAGSGEIQRGEPVEGGYEGPADEVLRDPGGSALGTQAHTRTFAERIFGSPYSGATTRREVTCIHPVLSARELAAGVVCDGCGGSGRRSIEETLYRHPMAAALDKLRNDEVPVGHAPVDVTLRALALAHGDVQDTASLLFRHYPAMGLPSRTAAHLARCLAAVRRVFRDDPPARRIREPADAPRRRHDERLREISESQAIAERGR